MNAERKKIWDKSGGKCWYCGADLPEKGWHRDHFLPVVRQNGQQIEERDAIDNLVPACAPCNLFKCVFSIEELRYEISQQVTRARKTSVNFRTAERFGLIEVKDQPVVFWFEEQK